MKNGTQGTRRGRRRHKPVPDHPVEGPGWRRDPLALAISAALACGGAFPSASAAGSSITVKDNKTETDISDAPGVDGGTRYTITTESLTDSGRTGLNAFAEFILASGDRADLVLPDGTLNLINLVYDSRAKIHGELFSQLDGEFGEGHLLFATPHGMLVGAEGAINAGALTAIAPRSSQLDRILDGDVGLGELMRGEVELDPEATIEIQGEIDADHVRLIGHQVLVQSGARIEIADPIDDHEAVFGSAVNIDGLESGAGIAVDAGDLVIAGERRAEVYGDLLAQDGGVVVRAHNVGRSDLGVTRADAEVAIGGRIEAEDITLSARVDAEAELDLVEALKGRVEALVPEGLEEVAESAIDSGLEAVDDELDNQDLPDFGLGLGLVDASAIVTLEDGAELDAGGNVNIHAEAQRTARAEAHADGDGLGGAFALASISGQTAVTVEEGASIVAGGDIDLRAASHNELVAEAVTEVGDGFDVGLGGSVALGFLQSEPEDGGTTVQVQEGATLAAGGDLGLSAFTEHDVTVDATTTLGSGGEAAFGATVAYLGLDWTTRTLLTGGAVADDTVEPPVGIVAGGDLRMVARTDQAIHTGASVETTGDISVGLAAAVAELNNTTRVVLDGTVRAGGDATLLAESITRAQHTVATTRAAEDADNNGGNGNDGPDEAADDQGTSDYVAGLVGDVDTGEPEETPGAGGNGGLALDIGAAVAYTDARDSASTTLGGNTQLLPPAGPLGPGGQVAIVSRRQLDNLSTRARSGTEATGPDGDDGANSINAAVSYARLDQIARTEIVDGARIEAGRIGVGAEVDLPARVAWGDEDNEDGPGGLDDIAGADSDDLDDWLTSEASTSSETGGTVNIAGAVNLLDLTATAEALVGTGDDPTDVTTLHAVGDGGDWETELGGDTTWHWDDAVAVAARSRVETVDVAGQAAAAGTVGVGGGVNWHLRESTARARLAGSADISADTGGVSVSADRRDRAIVLTPIAGESDGGAVGLGASVAYARIDGTSQAQLDEGAMVAAGGALAVTAGGDLHAEILTASKTSGDATAGIAGTVAFADISLDTTAAVHGQPVDNALEVGDLYLHALDLQDYQVQASAEAQGDVAIGLAGAVLDTEAGTRALLYRDVTTDGDVVLIADSETTGRGVAASTRAETGEAGDNGNGENNTGDDRDLNTVDFVQQRGERGNEGVDDGLQDVAGDPGAGQSEEAGFDVNVGAAVAFTGADDSAGAHIGEAVTISGPGGGAAGDVAVLARRAESGYRGRAQTEVETAPEDDGVGVGVGAALTLTFMDNSAEALIGASAVVDAHRVGVAADVILPDHFEGPAWDGLETLRDLAQDDDDELTYDEAESNLLDMADGWLTTYANAAAESEDGVFDGAAAVNFARYNVNADAWIGEGAEVTAGGTAGDTGWSTELRPAQDNGDPALSRRWNEAITVSAGADVRTIDVAGNVGGLLTAGVAGDATVGIGAGFAWLERGGHVSAGIADHAVVSASHGQGTIGVHAERFDQSIGIAPSSGHGASFAGNGTVVVNRLDTDTVAAVSHAAAVDAAALTVSAGRDLRWWSVAGSITLAESVAVGVGISVNELRTDTRAVIGDVAGLRPAMAGGGDVTELDDTEQGITADQVTVAARSDGLVGSASIAGGAAGETGEPPATDNWTDSGLTNDVIGVTSDRTEGAEAPEDETIAEAVQSGTGEPAGALDEQEASADDLDEDGDLANPDPTQPDLETFPDEGADIPDAGADADSEETDLGVAVAGSASVNLSSLNTTALIEDVSLAARDADTTDVTASAVAAVDTIAVSGSGALVLGGNSSDPQVAIAGTVGVNLLGDHTRARLVDTRIEQPGQVTVEALRDGELISVGMGLAITASGSTKAAAVAGSVSLSDISNETAATIEGGTIGDPGSDPEPDDGSGVQVLAYDRSSIGTGGGSLFGGKGGGFGAAVTLAQVRNTIDAGILGTRITDVAEVTVDALSATRIISAGAVLGYGGKGAVGGAVVLNRIGNTTKAAIADRDDGDDVERAEITANERVRVRARSASDDERVALDDRIDAAGGGHGYNFSGEGTALAEPEAEGDRDWGDDSYETGGDEFAGEGGDQAEIDSGYDDAAEDARFDGGPLEGDAIVGVAGSISASGKASIGLAFSGNQIDNDYIAEVRGARIDGVDGELSVDAADRSRVIGLGVGGGASGKVAIAGSGAANLIGGEARATIGGSRAQADDGPVHLAEIDAGAVNLGADRGSRIDALAGNVAFSGKAGIGAAVAYNAIDTAVAAEINHADLALSGGDLSIDAGSSADIYGVAVSGGGGGKVALNGSAIINFIDLDVSAGLGSSRVRDTGAVRITAGDHGAGGQAAIWSLAGAINGAGKVALGAAVAYNEIESRFAADITGADIEALGPVDVTAEVSGDINTLGAAGGGAGKVALGGAATVSRIDNTVTASLTGSRLYAPAALVTVAASQDSRIRALGAAIQGGGKVGGGAAVTVNQIGSAVTAEVTGGAPGLPAAIDDPAGGGDAEAHYHLGHLVVDARSDNEIQTIAAGAAAGGVGGVAGSVSTNLFGNRTKARIADGADVLAEGHVLVDAASSDNVALVAGSLGFGGKAFGAAGTVAVNIVESETHAWIGGEDPGDATVVVARAQQPGTVSGRDHRLHAIPGLVDKSDGENTFDDEDGVEIYDSEVDDAAEDRDGTGGGSTGGFSVEDEAGDYLLSRLVRDDDRGVDGVRVSARSDQTTSAALATAGISANVVKGGVGLAATALVNRIAGETTAGIRNGEVSAETDVAVSAGGHVHTRGLVIGAALGSVGASGAAAVDVVTRRTRAGIDDATVTAGGRIDVDAAGSQSTSGLAIGASGGTYASLAGGGVVSRLGAQTLAEVTGSRLEAGDVGVQADSDTGVTMLTGTVSVGAAAAAGSFNVAVVDAVTVARIADSDQDRSRLSVEGEVDVAAESLNRFGTIAASGAAGGTAIAGTLGLSLQQSITQARIEGAAIGQGDDDVPAQVNVRARDHLEVGAFAGGASLGMGMGLGAAANVFSGQASVLAEVSDGAAIEAGAVAVAAERSAELSLYTATLGAGQTGFSAGVGVILLGVGAGEVTPTRGEDDIAEDDVEGGLERELNGNGGGTLDTANTFANFSFEGDPDNDANTEDDVGGSLSDDQRDSLESDLEFNLTESVIDGDDHQTVARIDASDLRADRVDVTADDRVATRNYVGSGALGGVGFGAAVGFTRVGNGVVAEIGGDGTLDAGELTIRAGHDDLGGGTAAETRAWAGAAGGIGLAAAYADADVTTGVRATLGPVNLQRDAADDAGVELTIDAFDHGGTYAETIGVAAGFVAGVGAAISRAARTSTVIAEVADDTAVGSDDEDSADFDLSLSAVSDGGVAVDGIALGAGVVGGGAAALALGEERSTVQARVGNGADLRLGDGALTLDALARPDVTADGVGVAAAVTGAIAAAVSRAYSSATVEAAVGDLDGPGGAAVQARAVDVRARSLPVGSYGAEAEAIAGSIAKGVAVSGSFAFATDTATVNAGLGPGADLTLGGDGLSVWAEADPAARARTHARTFAGGVAFGANLSQAASNAEVAAVVGDQASVRLADGVDEADFTIRAIANDDGSRTAYATGAVSGGALLVSANGGYARAYEQTAVDARIGTGATLDAGAGEVRLGADATPHARAVLASQSYGGALAIGAAITDARVAADVTAAIGDGTAILGGGDLTVHAHVARPAGADSAFARSEASSGALASANAALAEARNHARSRALTGAGVTLPGGVVSLRAENHSRQHGHSASESYGAFAAGMTVTRVESDTLTHAILGTDNQASDNDDRPDVVDVTTNASSHDHGFGQTATGGAIDGAAAEVHTFSTADNRAQVLGHHSDPLQVSVLNVRALQDTRFSGVVDTSRASVAGASGARLYHNANRVTGIVNVDEEREAFYGETSVVEAGIGDHADIRALYVDVIAEQAVERVADAGNDIRVAGGGVLGASAGRGATYIETITRAGIGTGATVNVELDLLVRAIEAITAEQVARLNTGNAIDIARAESVMHTDHQNDVIIGGNANITAGGDVVLSNATELDLVAHTRARTSGVASFARGNSEAEADVREGITVGNGARLASAGNVVMRTGLGDGGLPARKGVEADTYLYNKGALPLENDPRVHADLVVDSRIDVADNAVVEAGQDAYLIAPVGFRYRARGEGEGQDIYRRAAESIANFFRRLVRADEVSLAKEVRSEDLVRGSTITIDGQVVGAGGMHQYLWVRQGDDDDERILASPGVGYFFEERDVRGDLEALVGAYRDLLGEYVEPDPDDPEGSGLLFWRAAAQIETLAGRLAALGDEDDGPYDGGRAVPFIEVEDITATGGDVVVRADAVEGGGEVRLGPDLEAIFSDFAGGDLNQVPAEFLEPGGPSIRILVESNEWLQVNDLIIDDRRDGSITIAQESGAFGGIAVPTRVSGVGELPSGLRYDTGGVEATPEIRVVHQFEVPPQEDHLYTNPEIRLGHEPDPADQLEGESVTARIVNPRGLVQVGNQAGSIISSASIEAATVEIVAGGNFVQNWIPGFFHAGGQPEAAGEASRILAGGDIYISAEHINVNGLIQSGFDEWTLDFSSDLLGNAGTTLGFEADKGHSLGDYLEWYGKGYRATEEVEEAPIPFWAQFLPPSIWHLLGYGFAPDVDTADVPDDFRTAYNAGRSGEQFLQLTGGEGFDVELGTVASFYDAEADRIDIQRATVGGGYIFLAGDVVSTGGGEIRALSGFGEIRVDTTGGGEDAFRTHQDVVLYDLDAGTQPHAPSFDLPEEELISEEGLAPCRPCVRIWDTAKRDGEGNPIETVFQHDWNPDPAAPDGSFGTIAKTVSRLDREQRDDDFFLLRTVVDEDDPFYDQEQDAGFSPRPGATAQYRPREGMRYLYGDSVDEDSGRLLFPNDDVPSGPGYQSMRADRAIDVGFIGNPVGTIDIKSVGDVIIDGSVRNPQGLTTVETVGSIREPEQGGLLQGRQLTLEAGGAVGSEGAPLRVIVGDGEVTPDDAWLVALAGDGGVFLDGLRGDLPVREVGTLSGHTVEIDAAGHLIDRGTAPDRPTVYGARVHLRARDGSIGGREQGEFVLPLTIASGVGVVVDDPDALPDWLNLPLGSANVTARAAGHVLLAEDARGLASAGVPVDGDIHVEALRAAEGDVRLFIADGKLISAIDAELDTDRMARLGEMWDSLGMLDDGSPNSGVARFVEDQVEAFEASVESRYRDWWELDRLAGEDGGFDLAPDRARIYAHRAGVDGSPEAWDETADPQGVADNTAAVNAWLEGRYGALSDELGELLLEGNGDQSLADLGTVVEEPLAEDPATGEMLFYERVEFDYQAPDSVRDQLAEGAEWTEEQLLNVLSEDRMLETVDTQYQRVETIIQGENVAIEAPRGSIGSSDDPLWIPAPEDEDSNFEFTEEERAALVTAQPGDVRLIGEVVLVDGQVMDLGDFLRLLGTGGPGGLTLEDLDTVDFDGIEIEQVRYAGVIATEGGQSHHAADDLGGDIFLGVPGTSIALERLWGGGDIRVRVGGGIEAHDDPTRGDDPEDAIIRGGAAGVLLEAAGGGIGAEGLPLTTALDPRALITARAVGSVHLHALGGNLTLDSVFSEQGDAVLAADQGHIARLALPGAPLADFGTLDIAADEIRLDAGTFVGAVDRDAFLALDSTAEPGDLEAVTDAAMRLRHGDDARVTGSAGDRFQVFAPEGGLVVRDVEAGGRVVAGAWEDVTLERVTSTAGDGEAAFVFSETGFIIGSNEAGLEEPLHLRALGGDATTRLIAPLGIGLPDDFLFLDATRISSATTLGGHAFLHGTTDLRADLIDVPTGRVEVRAPQAIEIDRLRVHDRVDLKGDAIEAHIEHTANPDPLPLDVVGLVEYYASEVDLFVDTPADLIVERLYARRARLETNTTRVDMPDNDIFHWLEVFTPEVHLWADNQRPDRRDVDVQLYEPGYRFFVDQDGRHTITNAFSGAYRPGYRLELVNYQPGRDRARFDVDGRSIVRDAGRLEQRIVPIPDTLPGLRAFWQDDEVSVQVVGAGLPGAPPDFPVNLDWTGLLQGDDDQSGAEENGAQ